MASPAGRAAAIIRELQREIRLPRQPRADERAVADAQITCRAEAWLVRHGVVADVQPLGLHEH